MKRSPWFITGVFLALIVAAAQPQSERRGVYVIVVAPKSVASDLLDRVRAGESFQLLAMRYSVGRSAADGGYIGTVRAEELRPELQAPLSRLKPGEVSPVTKVGEEFLLLRWSTPTEDEWRSPYNVGLLALREGRYPDAATSFLQAVDKAMTFGREDHRVGQSLAGLSRVYRLQKRGDMASSAARQSLEIFEKLLGKEQPALIPSLENLAAIEQARGESAEAVELYRRVLALRWSGPTSAERADTVRVLEKLADVLSAGYFKDAAFETSFQEFDRMIGKALLRETLYAGVSDGFLRVALVEEAAAVMRHAVEAFPDSRQVRYSQAEMYVKASRYEKALAAFEAALQRPGPADPAADRTQRSLIHERIGRMNALLIRFDRALAAYRTALDLSPDRLETHVALADLYLSRGRFDDALAEYTRAISINRDSAEAFRGLADLELQLGRFLDAASAANRAIELNPADRGSRYVQAVALIRVGRDKEGRTAMEEYQRLEAAARQADRRQRELSELRRSAVAKVIEGKQQEAIELLRNALDLQPDDAVVEARLYLTLGLAQARLGQHEGAIETFQHMIERGFSEFLVSWNLAAEYGRLGDSRSLQQRAVSLQKYDAALQATLN